MSRHSTLTILGLLVGLGIGYLTRPTIFFGVQAPLELLLSNASLDQPLRQALAMHLGLAAVIGAAVGIGLGIVLERR